MVESQYYAELESIGKANPSGRLSTQEIMSRLKFKTPFKFELLTGIKSRRICGPDQNSFTLAIEATQDCLSRSDIPASEVDLVISTSITKYIDGYHQSYEPSFSSLIRKKLGLKKARGFDISNACAGMFTGIYVAQAMIEQGSVRNCLIVSGEFISGLIDNAIRRIKTPLSQEFASLTVGDGGSAIMLRRTNHAQAAIQSYGFASLTRHNRLCMAQPKDGLPGADMKTRAKQIHEHSINESIPFVEQALEKFQLKYGDINFLIPHQTSRSAILNGAKLYANYFNEQPGEILNNLQENGNSASTSHFICLYDYLEKNHFKEDDRIVMISYASGITFGLITFQVNKLKNKYGSHS